MRLQKWYVPISGKEKKKIIQELIELGTNRKSKTCSIYPYRDLNIAHKRYASLNFMFAIDKTDNGLIILEVIHRFVEVMDIYFGNVCELDIVFNYDKAQYLLDELIIGGEIQDSNKSGISKIVSKQDEIQEDNSLGNVFKSFFDEFTQ